VVQHVGVDLRDDDPYPWDSHSHNLSQQTEMSEQLGPLLLRFVQRLHKANLLQSTLIIAISEMGRYPILNSNQGKDHFPEVPALLIGAGIAGAGHAFGATDRRMAALPIDLSTGRSRVGGHLVTIDDVGTTVLQVAGIKDPSVYGYVGTPLDFLHR
jgi:hypothetical protein